MFMTSHAPLGTGWLAWHFQRVYNFSEYLKLNGYFSNYGFSIWSSCKDCSLDAGNGENKIYLSSHFFPHLPYLIINHYFGQDERRFKKLGYLGMLWYMTVNFFNRHNLQHFEKAKVNYWD